MGNATILKDIKENTIDVKATKDRRYIITTKTTVYIFSDKNHLITIYPNETNPK